MESTLSVSSERDAILKPYKLQYASMVGHVSFTRNAVASNGPATFFTLEGITCRVGGKTIAIDHANFALFSWQTRLDETMVRQGAKLEVYGLIEQYVRRGDDTLGYGVKRVHSLRRA